MRPRSSAPRPAMATVELFGQSRALDAIRLAIGIDAPGIQRLRQRTAFAPRAGIGPAHAQRESGHDADAGRLGVRKQFPQFRISGCDLPAAGPGRRAARQDDGTGQPSCSTNCPRRFGARISIRNARRCATSTTSARRNCSAISRRGRASAASRSKARRPAR